MSNSAQQRVIAVLTALALAATFIACGFAVCAAVPATTKLLAENTCADELSAFDKEQLVTAAVATRSYTVQDNDRNEVMAVIARINDEAETPFAHATAEQLAAAPDPYTLTPEALDHLDDVHDVVNRVMPSLVGVAVLAGFLFMVTLRMFPLRLAGRELLIAGAIPMIVFVALAAWVAIDFNGFFAALHSLFFVDGSWTFPYDSLLICMYPQAFWMGMGIVWLVTTCLLSILSMVFGYVLSRKRVPNES